MTQNEAAEKSTKTESDAKWQVVHQMGRTQRPLAGPGTPEKMGEDFARLAKTGLPGNVLLLDENGTIVDQTANLAPDEMRRGKDTDGKKYEPQVHEIGQVAKGFRATGPTLAAMRDYIASLPETDPEEDPTPTPTFEEFAKKKATQPKQKPKQTARREPEQTPCIEGTTGLVGYVHEVALRLAELRHMEARARARRRKFIVELAIRLVAGAPRCARTARVAYADAEKTTRL